MTTKPEGPKEWIEGFIKYKELMSLHTMVELERVWLLLLKDIRKNKDKENKDD